MHISSAFDSGNIRVVNANDPEDIQLEIRHDAGDEHLQWFFFKVNGVRDTHVRYRIVNAGKTSYPKAWKGYRVCASTDREIWSRLGETTFDGNELVFSHTPETDTVWYAYFAPYSLERHNDLLAWASEQPGVTHDVLGTTVDGRDLDRIRVGTGPVTCWLIARQHPGEAMAEWWMEGFLGRLLDPDDALARLLREKATFHVVPHMNPDGSFRGHLRCNATGANLNREWHEPSLERSPEVKHVRDAMDGTGVDFCLDVHGDEELPYNFVSGAEGIEGWSDRLEALQSAFLQGYVQANPDFQTKHGYGVDAPGEANPSMCTNQVAQRFDCLAMTLEMPFIDNANAPDAEFGWSPERCRQLGGSVLHPLAAVIDQLR